MSDLLWDPEDDQPDPVIPDGFSITDDPDALPAELYDDDLHQVVDELAESYLAAEAAIDTRRKNVEHARRIISEGFPF